MCLWIYYIYICILYIYYIYEEVINQKSGTAIGTRFAPTYASTVMDEIETNFLDTQKIKLLVWFRYIDDVFFIWTHGKEKLEELLKDFNNYHPNIKLTHEFNKESIPFLDLKVSLSGGQLTTDLHIKSTDKHQYLHYTSAHPDHTKRSIFLVKPRGLAGYAIIKQILKDIWTISNHGSKQEATLNIKPKRK